MPVTKVSGVLWPERVSRRRDLAAFGAIVVVLWEGGRLVLAGALTPGTLVAFLLYAVTISGAITSLAGFWGNLQEAAGAAKRIFELLDHPELGHTLPQVLNLLPQSKDQRVLLRFGKPDQIGRRSHGELDSYPRIRCKKIRSNPVPHIPHPRPSQVGLSSYGFDGLEGRETLSPAGVEG